MGSPRTLAAVEVSLTPEEWRRRQEEAEAEALVLERVLTRVRGGESRSSVLHELVPDRPVSSTLRRLRRYEQAGRDGLVNRHLPVSPVRKMDDEARGALRALASGDPAAGSVVLSERLSAVLGRSVRPTAVQLALRDLGLARPRGRPRQSHPRGGTQAPTDSDDAVVTPLPLAGCELLKAVDEDIGAIGALTQGIAAHLAQLPPPQGPVLDREDAPPEERRADAPARGRARAAVERARALAWRAAGRARRLRVPGLDARQVPA
ncbi:MAG: hypothetical protein JRI25_27820 [Deltaproteobacteria bacterium]|nr:hypothetical protein [Deltaproteobacteria bacterium]